MDLCTLVHSCAAQCYASSTTPHHHHHHHQLLLLVRQRGTHSSKPTAHQRGPLTMLITGRNQWLPFHPSSQPSWPDLVRFPSLPRFSLPMYAYIQKVSPTVGGGRWMDGWVDGWMDRTWLASGVVVRSEMRHTPRTSHGLNFGMDFGMN